MIETHPFGSFIPLGAKYLILGSFSGRQSMKEKSFTLGSYDFFYGTNRNQFWPILGEIYRRDIDDTQSRKDLLSDLNIAMADIIFQCERKEGTNSDVNLINIVYAIEEITQIFEKNQIRKIFFTSRFTEKKFRSNFKDIICRHPAVDLVTLPSPSPRYVLINKEQKIKIYKELLPQISTT